jgi:hypothetical protein
MFNPPEHRKVKVSKERFENWVDILKDVDAIQILLFLRNAEKVKA